MLVQIVRLLLPLLPQQLAFVLTRTMASIPSDAPLKSNDRNVLDAARRIEFGRDSRKVAWLWGEGPTVVFVHGWGGRAGQMVGLAEEVANAGFQSVVFDVQAHGESPGRSVNFRHFIDDLAELVEFLNVPIHACVGHSAGALCMMAARELRGVHAARYVCLCAPLAPYVPVREIAQRLSPGEGVLRCCEEYYAAPFERSWQELDSGSAFRDTGHGRMLLVYDTDDARVDHDDDAIIGTVWPAAQVVKTRGLGHMKVLWDAGVARIVLAFLHDAPLPKHSSDPARAAAAAGAVYAASNGTPSAIAAGT